MDMGERRNDSLWNVLVSPATGWRQSSGVFHGNRLCGRQRGYRSGCVSRLPCAPTFLLPVTQPTHPPTGWISTAQASRFPEKIFIMIIIIFFLAWHDFDTGLLHILLKRMQHTAQTDCPWVTSDECFCRAKHFCGKKCDWFWEIMTMTQRQRHFFNWHFCLLL